MSQKQIERPQDKKPRPQNDVGPKTDLEIDIGSKETDAIIEEMDILQHPEKYTVEQRDCGCMAPPPRKSGFRR
jgi:hypothetical protein